MEKEFCGKSFSLDRARVLNFFQQFGAVGYFDGATKEGFCAMGVFLWINNLHRFNFKLHCGTGTNMKEKLLTLWCLCKVAKFFGIVALQVFGDSSVTIKWERGDYKLNVIYLIPWFNRICMKQFFFNKISFSHIYREHN